MDSLKFKELIDNFNKGIIYNDNSSYVSLILTLEILKRKRQEFLDKTKEYVDYLAKKLKIKINSFEPGALLIIYGEEKKYNPLFYHFGEILKHSMSIYCNTNSIYWNINGRDVKDEYITQIKEDLKTKEYMSYAHNFCDNYRMGTLLLSSNLGLNVFTRFENFRHALPVLITDYDFKNLNDISKIFNYKWGTGKNYDIFLGNFYYYINILNNERGFFDTLETKLFLNEELIGKIYTTLKIDISTFPKKLQDEIKQAEITLKASLSEKENAEMLALKELQTERIMRAYTLIKEATELLSLAKSDIGVKKIKIDNVNLILFKNNGIPNNLGYIEFEEFFKNNMILRMLDLSELDLTNVDIRGIDFSGTNIHIDPQVIYNKDLSYVNATDVKFSPFFDSFQDVILDGTIINDSEANIDLNLVRSYNHATHISKDVVRVLIRS